jgi:hypothetical protein
MRMTRSDAVSMYRRIVLYLVVIPSFVKVNNFAENPKHFFFRFLRDRISIVLFPKARIQSQLVRTTQKNAHRAAKHHDRRKDIGIWVPGMYNDEGDEKVEDHKTDAIFA